MLLIRVLAESLVFLSGDDKLTGGFDYDILDGGDGFDISYDSVSDIVIKCEEQL